MNPFILTMSPAKRFHQDPTPIDQATHAHFSSMADHLVEQLRPLGSKELKSMMSISDTIADLNVKRFQTYQLRAPQVGSSAAMLFAGDAYQSLDFQSLSDSEMVYAQACLFLLSGLYGLLRPLDLIQPYRLEMGCNTKDVIDKTLYDVWREPLTAYLNQIIDDYSFKYHLNLASTEYAKAIDAQRLTIPTIDIVFATPHASTYKVIGIKAKRARGAMARHIIRSRPQSIEAIKEYNLGYQFNPGLSTEHRFVFLEG